MSVNVSAIGCLCVQGAFLWSKVCRLQASWTNLDTYMSNYGLSVVYMYVCKPKNNPKVRLELEK
jgi:hypothetical protein